MCDRLAFFELFRKHYLSQAIALAVVLMLGAAPVMPVLASVVEDPPLTVRTVPSPSNGGRVSGDVTGPVAIHATPNEGWRFDGWYYYGHLYSSDAIC